jgi:hypothetical protein
MKDINLTHHSNHKFYINNDFYNTHSSVQITQDSSAFFIGDDYVSLEELAYEY